MNVLKPACLSALALAAMASATSAAPFNVQVSGWCAANCAAVGLSQDALFEGTVGVDNATFVAGQWDAAAITSIAFGFGTFAFDQSAAVFSDNSIEWGSTPDTVSGISIFAFGSDNPAAPGPLLSLTASDAFLGTGLAAIDAFYATDAAGRFTGSLGNAADIRLQVLGYEPGNPTPVPLPAAGWLLAGALLGLAGLRRARRG